MLCILAADRLGAGVNKLVSAAVQFCHSSPRFRQMFSAAFPVFYRWPAALTSSIAHIAQSSFVLRTDRKIREFIVNFACAPTSSHVHMITRAAVVEEKI